MKCKLKRIAALVLALVVTATLLIIAPMTASALSYSGSASYKSGPYYSKLCGVNLTGNQRTDIVNIAKSQVGYQEGANTSQLSGTVRGTGNCTEYGRWYGMQDMWCAIFVSWCANVAGVPTSVVPKHHYTPTGLNWFQSRGLAYSRAKVASGGYTPQPGDIVYFKSGRNSNATNHVGIVTGYSGGTLYTVEGNTKSETISTNGGAVAAKSYSISNTFIVYICSPKYSGGSTPTPTQNTNFTYNMEGFAAIPGGVHIQGWCFDKRSPSQPLSIHVYFGGPAGSAGAEGNPFTVANVKRTDVDNVHHCGANHGFDADVLTSKTGNIGVYIYAVNPASGESVEVFSFMVNIPSYNDFQYTFDDFKAVPGGVNIWGWAFDKNHPETALKIHTYIGGSANAAGAEGYPHTVANQERTDVDAAYHCGKNHGFNDKLYTSKRGRQPVYVYAVNPTNGGNVLIKSFTVDIPEPNNPEGVVDDVIPEAGKIRVKGWAIDKDDLSESIHVHVYIGGPAGSANAEGYNITADTLRSDVDNAYHYGKNHGFDSYIATKKTGIQDVYIYAININGGQNVRIGSTQVAIPADTENPVITETGIDHVTNDSYRVTVKAEDNAGIDRVEVWTWTRQQTDMEIYDAEWGEDGEFYADISRSNHSGTKNNLYHNHIFAYDVSGNVVKAVQDYDYAISSDTGKNIAEGVYRIVSAADETKALDISGASVEDNANVHVYANLTDSNQTFALEYSGDGFYKIKNTHSGKYLDVYGGTYQNGTNVAQWVDNNDVCQQWKIQNTNDCFYIIARNNGLALTVQNDDDVKVNTLTNASNQKWKLRRVLDSSAVVSCETTSVETITPRPVFKLRFDGKTLTEDVDFTVSTANLPQDEGEGVITLTGKGDYCDSLSKSFNVTFVQFGDLNNDKWATVKDATLLQYHLAKFEPPLSGDALALADVNGDGKINVRDVTEIQRHAAELTILPRRYYYG